MEQRSNAARMTMLAAAIVAALAALALVTSVANAAAGPQRVHRTKRITACTRSVTVLIQVYQFFSQPTSNGCWGYNRSVQNAGQGMGNWTICFGNGSQTGTGPNRVFDDTSPGMTLSVETSRINNCGNLYGENMARRSQNG